MVDEMTKECIVISLLYFIVITNEFTAHINSFLVSLVVQS